MAIMTHAPMLIGLPPEQLRAFVEARLGPLADLGVAVLVRDHSQSQLKQTRAWLGQWALEHPDTTYPWRREQARRQVAVVARQLDRPPATRMSVPEIERMLDAMARRRP